MVEAVDVGHGVTVDVGGGPTVVTTYVDCW